MCTAVSSLEICTDGVVFKYKHKFTFITGPSFLTFMLATYLFLASDIKQQLAFLYVCQLTTCVSW